MFMFIFAHSLINNGAPDYNRMKHENISALIMPLYVKAKMKRGIKN